MCKKTNTFKIKKSIEKTHNRNKAITNPIQHNPQKRERQVKGPWRKVHPPLTSHTRNVLFVVIGKKGKSADN